jgi:lysophospholipase L1-like esterase
MLDGAADKMAKLPAEYARIAAAYGIDFLDAGSVASPNDLDGVHLDEYGHEKLAQKIYEIIEKKAWGKSV